MRGFAIRDRNNQGRRDSCTSRTMTSTSAGVAAPPSPKSLSRRPGIALADQ
jgi:hypothetical protein